MRVYRWDLDKTYLETDFGSLRALVRSAVEPASAKRAIPGATALMQELAQDNPGWRPRIFILSGSPTQMRKVLEEKLRIDGVRWDELILKDNLANLRKGRLRAVRGQFGYKLPALLSGRFGLGPLVHETLFGDDAEVDALVYSVYADAIAGRIAPVELSRILAAAGAYPDHVVDALSALRRVEHADAVDRIFIRQDRGRALDAFAALGPRVILVRSWVEAAIVLAAAGELAPASLERVRAATALSEGELVARFRSVLERGHVEPEGATRAFAALAHHPAWVACAELLRREAVTYRPPTAPVGLDWVELVRAFEGKR